MRPASTGLARCQWQLSHPQTSSAPPCCQWCGHCTSGPACVRGKQSEGQTPLIPKRSSVCRRVIQQVNFSHTPTAGSSQQQPCKPGRSFPMLLASNSQRKRSPSFKRYCQRHCVSVNLASPSVKDHEALVPSPSHRLSLIESNSSATLGSGQDDAGPKDVEEGKTAESSAPDPPPSNGGEDAVDVARSALQGRICLLFVAVLWGTYPVALRSLYALPSPPTPEALTAIRAALQASVLLASSLIFTGSFWGGQAGPHQGISKPISREPTMQVGRSPLGRWLGGSTDSLVLAGAELGFWNFLASSFQAIGLEITSATRASFLIQVTALLTPALATAAGDRPGKSVWLGCGVAMLGTLLLSLDKAPGVIVPANAPHIALGGDACIFASALFYSLATVRLSRLAASVSSLQLATAKSLAFAVIAMVWLAVLASNQVVSQETLRSLWEGYASPIAWLLLAWSALGPGALAAFLQTQGQKRVAAAEAQIIFSSLPLWSALFAAALLQGESMGSIGWAGGLLIVCAGIIASNDPEKGERKADH